MADEIIAGHAIGAFVIGIIEIILAVIVIICSIVLHTKVSISTALTPYWAGVPYIVTGILGVLLMWKRNMCLMISFLVCNIITFIAQGIGFIIIAIVVAVYASYADHGCTYNTNVFTREGQCRCRSSGGDTWTFTTSKHSCDLIKDVSTLLYVLVIFLALAACVSLAGSILGCIGTCCRGNAQPGAIIMTPQQQQQQPGTYNPPTMPTYNQPPPYYTDNTNTK